MTLTAAPPPAHQIDGERASPVTATGDRLRVLCLNPLVAVVEDAFDQATADALSDRLSGPRQAVPYYQPRRERGTPVTRESSMVPLDLAESRAHPITRLVTGLLNVPVECTEVLRVMHYGQGGRFDPHRDALTWHFRRGRFGIGLYGQRIYTVLGFLNDAPEGGETAFPALGLTITPKTGRLLIFADTRPGSGRPHPHSVHAGMPVIRGEKRIVQLMVRERAPPALGPRPGDGRGWGARLRLTERRLRHARKRWLGY